MNCKFCKHNAPSNLQGYCQSCYHYFITVNKETYDTPPYGEIWYAPNGDCICPLCGKAFRKLGMHFYYAHKLKAKEAHKILGWDLNAKATNLSYRILMRNRLHQKCVSINLLERGINTRYINNSPGRTKEKISRMTLKRLKQQSFVKRKLEE